MGFWGDQISDFVFSGASEARFPLILSVSVCILSRADGIDCDGAGGGVGDGAGDSVGDGNGDGDGTEST